MNGHLDGVKEINMNTDNLVDSDVTAGYAPNNTTKQCIVVRKDLDMDAGKLGAQVAHASMAFFTKRENRMLLQRIAEDGTEPTESWLRLQLSDAQRDWLDSSFTKIVLECMSEDELNALIDAARNDGVEVHPIIDNGTTVFGKPTLTCAAFGPDYIETLDKHLRHLKLYTTKSYKVAMPKQNQTQPPPPPDVVRYTATMGGGS